MDPSEAPGCTNHMFARSEFGEPEPTHVCSCAVGIVHMHDCPVTLGLRCSLFHAGPPDLQPREAVEHAHERMMQDYLTRAYYHRVRSLAPAGDPWQRRREELYAYYATVELAPADTDDDEEEAYERERERLIELRRRRDEARRESEERSREEKAKERARLGIKTVVEKARDAVANQGNVASSVVDELELPDRPKRKRRRRRRGKRAAGAGAGGGPGPEGGGAGGGSGGGRKRKRRRRRRRKGGAGGDESGGGGRGSA